MSSQWVILIKTCWSATNLSRDECWWVLRCHRDIWPKRIESCAIENQKSIINLTEVLENTWQINPIFYLPLDKIKLSRKSNWSNYKIKSTNLFAIKTLSVYNLFTRYQFRSRARLRNDIFTSIFPCCGRCAVKYHCREETLQLIN